MTTKVFAKLTFDGRVLKIPHADIDRIRMLPWCVTIKEGNFDQLFINGKRRGRVHTVREDGDYFGTDAGGPRQLVVTETEVEVSLEFE